jgi:hypothetical protein
MSPSSRLALLATALLDRSKRRVLKRRQASWMDLATDICDTSF